MRVFELKSLFYVLDNERCCAEVLNMNQAKSNSVENHGRAYFIGTRNQYSGL